jgi:hypothetical protein
LCCLTFSNLLIFVSDFPIFFVNSHNICGQKRRDQKENKSEQALQIIIGHVVAELNANKRSMQMQTLLFIINHASRILDGF